MSRLDLWTRIKSLLPGEEHGKEEAKVEEAPPPEDAFKKETQERQAAADAAITDFVKGQLGDPNAPPPPWRLPKPRDTQTQEDRAKMREAMGEGWTEIERRAKQVAAGHKDAAHDHVWAVYTRQSTPHSLDELILVYMLAGHAYATVQNKIEERGYFEYFFAKISHLLLQQRDKYDNTLLHYLLAFEGSKSARVVACMDAMARAAKRQAKQTGADEKTKGMTIEERAKSDTLDDRKTVHQFFAEQKNVVGESVMDLMVRFGDRKTLKQAETILAHLFSPEEEAAASAAKGTGLDRVQAVQEKPFNQADFEAIIGGDDTAAKALYIRMFADHIAPEQMEAALKSKQVDLMQLDLAEITLAKDQARNITKKNAIAPGAVNNSYAKQGIFNVEFARKKLVRDDGKRSQGFRDERGYNTSLQMAALKSMPSAYIDNEHEFWDSIFTRIAKFQAQNDPEKREVRYFYT
ncbi:MAG: hypothetical protein JNK11_04160, partial [Alphaproteobacteria bacterium]|nr:hypothetical protein [Alphaproteobacteria bacterium]